MGGSTTQYHAPTIPGYQRSIGKEYANFLQNVSGGFPSSPFNLGYVSPTQRAAWSQAEQFGATGLQPFTDTLTAMSRDGGMQDADALLSQIGQRSMEGLSQSLRQQAAMSGMSSGSSLDNALAQGGKDIALGLGQQRLGLFENAQNRRLQASQQGLTAVPSALNQLSQIGAAEYEPIQRQYNDWVLRNIQGPISAFGGSNAVMNQSANQGAYSVSQDNTGQVMASLIGAMLMAFA